MIPQFNETLVGSSERTLMSTTTSSSSPCDSNDRASRRHKRQVDNFLSHHHQLPQHKQVTFAPITEIYSSEWSSEEIEQSWYTVSSF